MTLEDYKKLVEELKMKVSGFDKEKEELKGSF